jgi:LCP family protein required for cell wall assembly
LSNEQTRAFGKPPGARADIIMVVRTFDDGRPPAVMSIPRDLLVPGIVPGTEDRLALRWLRGPQHLVDTLCSALGLGVDHLVAVDMAGFVELVDALGGIDLQFDERVRDTVIAFEAPAGREHLDGERALQLVRARHLERPTPFYVWEPLPNSRAENAERVLTTVMSKAKPGLNPWRNHRIAWSGSDALSVDDGTGVRDLWHLASALRRFDPASSPVEFAATLRDDARKPMARIAPGASAALDRVGRGGECGRGTLVDAAR